MGSPSWGEPAVALVSRLQGSGSAEAMWEASRDAVQLPTHRPPRPHTPYLIPLGRRCGAPAPPTCVPSPPSALGPSVPQILRSPRGHPLQTQAECHHGGVGSKERHHKASPSPALQPGRNTQHPCSQRGRRQEPHFLLGEHSVKHPGMGERDQALEPDSPGSALALPLMVGGLG